MKTDEQTKLEKRGVGTTEFFDAFGERAVTLCDGRAGLRGALAVKASAAPGSNGAPVVDFIGSDETLDRYDEIIAASGWKLDNYRKNPVFQNSHKYGDVMHTLGKSLITEVRGGKLFQRIEFATAINPIANVAYELYRGGFLNAVSVGFIPLKWENGTEKAGCARKYTEHELLELSAVSVPANPNALQQAVKAGAVDRSDLRELLEFLQKFCRGTRMQADMKCAQ